MSLVARHLEATGTTTVVVGSARDIVEHCAVPRFCFTDFPLGNPCGKPGDVAMQTAIVGAALDLAESATAAMTTVQTPHRWDERGAWRTNFMRVGPDNADELRRRGEERLARQRARRAADR
ncbi:MAG: hypothetical protein AAGA17_05705 [Actinomycetota bacterium]